MGFTKQQVSKEELEIQQAHSVPNSNRSLWGGGLVRGLTPARLASIIDLVRNGETPAEYLEIAQELEQRDAHYRSVLSSRKHAVEGLELYVQSAGDSPEDKAIADAVERDIVNHPDIMDLKKNALDALGKGFSVNEIIWDTEGIIWKPKTFKFRDPRWFAYDKDTGILCLRDALGISLTPLRPNHFVVHEPNLISGMQITSGLSFTALFYWLVKNYDITSWAAFADRFGYPVRLGKYGKKATKEDIETLKRAVASIGSDVGAVIPDSMIIEIVESSTTGTNALVYQDLAEWADKQLSKLVVGQTASAEGTPGKLGDSAGQEAVRQDFVRADAAQLDKTFNSDLVIPYVRLNFGPRASYPLIKSKLVESKNVQLIVSAIQALVPMGLKVSTSEVLGLLGLTPPGDQDEILEAPAFDPGMMGGGLNTESRKIDLNAEESGDTEDADDFAEITDEIAEVIENAASETDDYDSFLKKLNELAVGWPADKIAELMAVAAFKARTNDDEDSAE